MRFEPGGVAVASSKVWVCDNAAKGGEVRCHAFNGGFVECALGFAHDGVPGWAGYDNLGEQAVEGGPDHMAWCKSLVDSDAVASRERYGCDLPYAERPVLGNVFGCHAQLTGKLCWWREWIGR